MNICLISCLHSLFPNYVCFFESLFVPWAVLFLLLFVLYVFVSLLIKGESMDDGSTGHCMDGDCGGNVKLTLFDSLHDFIVSLHTFSLCYI